MTRGLFEVDDAYEQSGIRLTKDIAQLKDSLKVQSGKEGKLNKQLSEMKKKKKETVKSQLLEMTKQKESTKSKCLELEVSNISLI